MTDEEEPQEPVEIDEAEWQVVDAPAPERTFDDFVAMLRTGSPDACAEAVDALSELGADVLPKLQALLDDDDQDLIVDIKKAIRLIEETLP